MLRIFSTATPEALADIAEEMRVRQTKHFILLFSMGSQFDHLIVQQLAKLGVYCVVADPASVKAKDVRNHARRLPQISATISPCANTPTILPSSTRKMCTWARR